MICRNPLHAAQQTHCVSEHKDFTKSDRLTFMETFPVLSTIQGHKCAMWGEHIFGPRML